MLGNKKSGEKHAMWVGSDALSEGCARFGRVISRYSQETWYRCGCAMGLIVEATSTSAPFACLPFSQRPCGYGEEDVSAFVRLISYTNETRSLV